MLRECHRVLEPEGRLAAVTIELVPGLDEDDRALAPVLGPDRVAAPAPLDVLLAEIGFAVDEVVDLTVAFRAAVEGRLDGLTRHEVELRRLEGDATVEEERAKRSRMLEAIDRQLIRRTLVVARR